MKKRVVALLVILPIIGAVQYAFGETKDDTEVFEKWIQWQKVFKDCSLQKMCDVDDQNFWAQFTNTYHKYQSTLYPFKPFFNNVCGGGLNHGNEKHKTFEKVASKKLYQSIDGNTLHALNYMKEHDFLQPSINHADQAAHIDDTINKYRRVLKVLLSIQNKQLRHQASFAFANRMFESCYGPKSFNRFYRMLNDESFEQIMRFSYSTMWFYLVGDGWKHWHENCLNAVKKEAQQGKEIVYIAGGNDIYQLLKNGVYKIRVIDPMLPSQPDYYAEGWDWLLQGGDNKGLGDQLTISCDDKNLIMKREMYQENGLFQATLASEDEVTLPLSITRWGVYDAHENKRLGHVIFERRFCNQGDFTQGNKKSLLISFNEMYFVAMPPDCYGWGIDLTKLPNNLRLHVKQLRSPVTKRILANVKKGEDTNFSFIMLGSCAT